MFYKPVTKALMTHLVNDSTLWYETFYGCVLRIPNYHRELISDGICIFVSFIISKSRLMGLQA